MKEYTANDGTTPFRKWYDGLDRQAARKITSALMQIGYDNTSNIKRLGGGLGEIKISYGPGYRVYLAQDGKDLLILYGGSTKSDQRRGIAHARELHEDYKKRKAIGKKARND